MFSPATHPLCLITDDGTPTTDALAASLVERGWQVVVLALSQRDADKDLSLPQGVKRMVLPPEEQVPELLCTLTEQYGSLGAFIYLHPTHWQDSESDAGLAEKAALKQVFLLLRHLKQPLQQAAQQERGALLMVTRLDGSLGISLNNDFSPLAGGVFGLLKTLYQEWESVFCRAIDMAPSLNTKQSVRCILAELYDPSPLPVEVGYSSEGRTTLVAEAAPLVELPAEPTNSIRSTSVFLVSGGARGITAHCVFRLAQHYRCRFILLGRSQLHEEPAWAQGLDEAALKQRLLTEMSTQGKKLTPRMLKEAYKSLMAGRQIRSTLDAIEAAGGQAVYLSVDVTDPVALQQNLEQASAKLGSVTGIIHGAGNIADKLIENKSAQDFETVYRAKVEGLTNLLKVVSPGQLEHLILFSSVVAFYGNVGQADYALANEILNKTAYLFKRRFPNCRVLAFNWGPWDGGMVTPELQRLLTQQAVDTIPATKGAQMFLDELTAADTQVVQVVIGSPLIQNPKLLISL